MEKYVFGKILAALIAVIAAGPNALAETKIESLSWLAGHWVGTYQNLPMEAHYTTGTGGIILGMTKIASADTTAFFEFEQFAQMGDSLVLRPYPFGKQGVEFPAKEISGTRVVFENPTHDYPARIIYELGSDGVTLLARIEGMENGQPAFDQFIFTKAK